MLGEIKVDLKEAAGAGAVSRGTPKTMFGFGNEGWKPVTTLDGTPVLVLQGFNTGPGESVDILMYPESGGCVPPSGRMLAPA